MYEFDPKSDDLPPAARRFELAINKPQNLSPACADKALLASLQSPYVSPTPLPEAHNVDAAWVKLSSEYSATCSTSEQLENIAFRMVHLAETGMSIDDVRRFAAYSYFAEHLRDSDNFTDALIVYERLRQYFARSEEQTGEVHEDLIDSLLDMHELYGELRDARQSEAVLSQVLQVATRVAINSRRDHRVILEVLPAIEDVASAARKLKLPALLADATRTVFHVVGLREMSASEALVSLTEKASGSLCLGPLWGVLAKGVNADANDRRYISLLVRQKKALREFLTSLEGTDEKNTYKEIVPRYQEDLVCCSLALVEAWLSREHVNKAIQSFEYAAQFAEQFEEGDVVAMFEYAEEICELLEAGGNTPRVLRFMQFAKNIWESCPDFERLGQLEWAVHAVHVAHAAEESSTGLEIGLDALKLFHQIKEAGDEIPPALELQMHYEVGSAMCACKNLGDYLDDAREHLTSAVRLLTNRPFAFDLRAVPDHQDLLLTSHFNLAEIASSKETRDHHLDECIEILYAMTEKDLFFFNSSLTIGKKLFSHGRYERAVELYEEALASTATNAKILPLRRIRMLRESAQSAWMVVETLPVWSSKPRTTTAESKVLELCKEGLTLICERKISKGQINAQLELLKLKCKILQRRGASQDALGELQDQMTILTLQRDEMGNT